MVRAGPGAKVSGSGSGERALGRHKKLVLCSRLAQPQHYVECWNLQSADAAAAAAGAAPKRTDGVPGPGLAGEDWDSPGVYVSGQA